MGSDKVGRDRSQKALEVKAYSFCLMLQKRASQWKNAKQKKRQYKKAAVWKHDVISSIQGRGKRDKRALFKVRKKGVEMQNVKVLIGSWMGGNVIQKDVKMYM